MVARQLRHAYEEKEGETKLVRMKLNESMRQGTAYAVTVKQLEIELASMTAGTDNLYKRVTAFQDMSAAVRVLTLETCHCGSLSA